jgi:hypothetical protein
MRLCIAKRSDELTGAISGELVIAYSQTLDLDGIFGVTESSCQVDNAIVPYLIAFFMY